jgi:hypothetical protein
MEMINLRIDSKIDLVILNKCHRRSNGTKLIEKNQAINLT